MAAQTIKFLMFSDFHYRKDLYPPTVAELHTILKRGADAGVDFAIHAGDFSNDYKNSPELFREYLENEWNLPVYGVTGNHELEAGNVLDFVLPRLSNRPEELTFGRADAAYYYFERNGFRIVSVDTNHSYSEERDAWERNIVLAKPKENIYDQSLGKEQLVWLEAVLTDAAERGLSCIVVGHSGFSTLTPKHSPDAERVCAIYRRVNEKRAGTVLLSINGHYHTNHLDISDGVLFFDVNTALNGHWQREKEPHYEDCHIYTYTEYDESGTPLTTETRPLSSVRGSTQTWYFRDPLSAVVTVTSDGDVTIEGMESEWRYGIAPQNHPQYAMPSILSYKGKL